MNNNVSVKVVFDRKKVATKKTQGLVQLEIMFERKRKYVGTGIKLYADQWGKNGKIKNHPQSSQLNQTINNLVSKIYSFLTDLENAGESFNLQMIDDLFSEKKTDVGSFIDFMQQRIEERAVSETTKARQRCVLKALREFGKINKFTDITPRNIKLYDDFAKSKCQKQSSVYNYHKILKTFIHEALALELIGSNPYDNFKVSKGETNFRKFLNKEELSKIEQTPIENSSLCKVRDMFLFCCYTGLAYSDLKDFDFSQASFVNGMYRLRDFRHKTQTEFNISLIDKAMAILRQYSFSLPIISNQKYNSYLKVLGAFCGLKTRLTSHMARHTFATTIALANGVQIEIISKMLGHTNIKTTQVYAKVLQSEVDKEFNRLNLIV